MLYLQIASPKSSVLNFLDSNSFEVIISIFQRTEKVPDMERLPIIAENKSYEQVLAMVRLPQNKKKRFWHADQKRFVYSLRSRILQGNQSF